MAKSTKTIDTEGIKRLLTRNVEQVIESEHLAEKLLSGKKLRVKFGIDPTGPKIHIGRAVALWKLREFQDLGHKIVLIIGDFTAQIGDASDKLGKRPFLSKDEVKKNLKNYLPQIGKILDLKKVELRYNSEWLKKVDLRKASELAELFTLSQMVERRNFKERFNKQEEISLRELLYPIMQGYDSVAVKADVELGGTDQLFNLLAGRKIQQAHGQEPQDIMTTQMLLGTDGRKMSTSWGNVVNIMDEPNDQYGKIMAMRDESIIEYFWLATGVDDDAIHAYRASLEHGENPKTIKEKLAFEVVKRYHGEKKAIAAADHFTTLFSKKEVAADIPNIELPSEISAVDAVMASGAVKSRSEAWRLVEQGGLKVNDVPKGNPKEILRFGRGDVLKVGKRHFFRVK